VDVCVFYPPSLLFWGQVAEDDLSLLAAALHPFTFAASDASGGRVGVPRLVAVRLRSGGEAAWLPVGGLGCERTVRARASSPHVARAHRLSRSAALP
jgi:hypothetical protein